MAKEADLIRLQIAQTRNDLSDGLETLEKQVWETVQDAKHTVEETIDSIKTGVEHMKPSYQIQKHPFIAAGVAVTAGTLAGVWIAGRRPEREGPRLRQRGGEGFQALSPVIDEIKSLRFFALDALVQGVAQVARKNLPQYANVIDQVFRGFSQKLDAVRNNRAA